MRFPLSVQPVVFIVATRGASLPICLDMIERRIKKRARSEGENSTKEGWNRGKGVADEEDEEWGEERKKRRGRKGRREEWRKEERGEKGGEKEEYGRKRREERKTEGRQEGE